MHDGGELRVWCHGAHVALVGHHARAFGFEVVFCGLRHSAGSAVVGEHVGPLIDERLRGFALTCRVEPGIEPQHFDLRFWVDRAHAQGERVDALNHFGHRKTSHIACGARPAGLACQHAREVACFVVADVVCVQVGSGFVATRVLELHARKFSGHPQCRLKVAEAGGEDELVALLRQVAHHTLGVGPFIDAFDHRGVDFVAECLLHGDASKVVLVCPARIADGADVDESNFERWGDRRRNLRMSRSAQAN